MPPRLSAHPRAPPAAGTSGHRDLDGERIFLRHLSGPLYRADAPLPAARAALEAGRGPCVVRWARFVWLPVVEVVLLPRPPTRLRAPAAPSARRFLRYRARWWGAGLAAWRWRLLLATPGRARVRSSVFGSMTTGPFVVFISFFLVPKRGEGRSAPVQPERAASCTVPFPLLTHGGASSVGGSAQVDGAPLQPAGSPCCSPADGDLLLRRLSGAGRRGAAWCCATDAGGAAAAAGGALPHGGRAGLSRAYPAPF
jgi:hypothetical protein